MSDQIVKLVSKPVSKPTNAKPANNKRYLAHLSQHNATTYAMGVCAITLTALSLTHLAKGISILTGSPMWEAIAMAIGTDFGFIVVEAAMLTALNKKDIEKWATPTVYGLLLWSAFLNAFAFSAQSVGWMAWIAGALGVSIPALMFSLMRIASIMYIHAQSRN